MLKFFQKIRYNHMSENKTGKYFKYAIGEIILVVIGILIALQINNWNEERKSQKAKTQYCEQLLEELELDTKAINTQIEKLDRAIKAYNAYDVIYESPNVPLDTIYSNMKKLPSIYDQTTFNTKTIDVLKSTGDIKLLSNEIQTLLVTLETLQGLYYKYNDANYGIYLSSINETYLMNVLSIERKLVNQDPLAKALDFKNKLPEQLAKQHLAFNSKYFADINASRSLNNILKAVDELKTLVEKELKE